VQGCLSKHNTSQLPCCQQRLIRELLELFNSVCFVRRDELDAREEQCAAVTLALGSKFWNTVHWDQRLPYQDSLNFLHDLVSVCFCRLRSGAFFARDPHCHSL
jgi:hypothetical protein